MSLDKNDLISLQLNIAGKMYPVKLTAEEQRLAKQIEKEINQKINDFRMEYKSVDEKDVLVMVLLTYAFDMRKNKTSENHQLDQKLTIIEKLVDDHIS